MLDATAPLTICLLGAPQVQVARVPLSLNHQKAQALLYYLAATAQPHTREHLATLLWSESTASNAHHSLRSTLYHLRQAFQSRGIKDRLVEDGNLLRLAISVDECDVSSFRQHLAGNDERMSGDAVALYRGRFLQGFSLASAPLFDEWMRDVESELSQAYVRALHGLAEGAESRQEWNGAIGYLQRIAQADPLDEQAQQQLMRLYIHQGAAGLALRQYQQFEAQLRHELNVAPSAETRALFSQILQKQAAPPPSSRDSTLRAANRISQVLPFIGREDLLLRLLAISQDAAAERGMTVLLEGEVGVGKTRLLDELVHQLEAGSPVWMILRGSCSPFDDLLSHGPFLEAFQSTAAGDLSGLFAEPDNTAPDARGRFFHSVLQAVRTLASRGPLLIAIDDLQWANSSTLNLFGFLALRLGDLPVVLIGTAQNPEVIPALQRLIALGRRRGTLHLMSVTPLTTEDVARLLDALRITPTSHANLLEWLHERSSGSPFVLAEILAQMRTEGIIDPSGARWRLDSRRWMRWRATFTLPETTHDLISWRLSSLASKARQVLDILAVAGHPLTLPLIRELPGFESDQLVTVLEDLFERQLIVEIDAAQFALPHYFLRETLLHHMSQIRRRLIHRQLGEVLERYLHLPGIPRQVALHAVAGEDVDRARRYGPELLNDLSQYHTDAVTVEFAHHLYDLIAAKAVPEERLALTRILGRLHQSRGDLVPAKRWHRQNLDIAIEMNDPLAQATAHFELAEVSLVIYDYHAAMRSAEAGLAACSLSGELRSAGLVGRGHRLFGAGMAMEGSDLAGAEIHLQTAAGAHRETGNLSDLCATLFELGNLAAQRGDLQRALHFYQDAAQAAESGNVHYYLALAWNNHAYHSLLLGDIESAQHSVDTSLKLAETYEMLGVLLYLYSTQGEINLYQGDWAGAEESFHRGSALAEELGSIERQAGYHAGLALVARGRGDLAGAITAFED
ncbi:MAG TPA: AAA family ATPase, partial [Anaerolineae bacterium]